MYCSTVLAYWPSSLIIPGGGGTVSRLVTLAPPTGLGPHARAGHVGATLLRSFRIFSKGTSIWLQASTGTLTAGLSAAARTWFATATTSSSLAVTASCNSLFFMTVSGVRPGRAILRLLRSQYAIHRDRVRPGPPGGRGWRAVSSPHPRSRRALGPGLPSPASSPPASVRR